MSTFYFERECRTPHSECYTVVEDDNTVGRVDLHFTDTVVHATLSVIESLTSERIQELIDIIDEELVDSVGISREELIVHVHQGRDLGVFSSQKFEGNGGGPPGMA
jgi:mevalonate kinase